MNYLDEAFGLESLKIQDTKEEPQGRCIPPWPCIPRKKCYLSSADSILDLPTYSYAAFPELLDWSKGNILVAALGRNYHKWSWGTQNLISEGFTEYDIQNEHEDGGDPRQRAQQMDNWQHVSSGSIATLRNPYESYLLLVPQRLFPRHARFPNAQSSHHTVVPGRARSHHGGEGLPGRKIRGRCCREWTRRDAALLAFLGAVFKPQKMARKRKRTVKGSLLSLSTSTKHLVVSHLDRLM
ncbi:Cell division cycle protein 20 [Operophtera brumata]|uniref:Cell division cycle protein 20 n=1 Tax=Operophtera brumata TaxID=104452 RepID=A0A0L7KZF8_OPEBR|nr:Cell division cycle protein 20 [Operophtera brumata]